MKRNCAVFTTLAVLCFLGLLITGCGNAEKVRDAVNRGNAAMEKGDFGAAARAYEEALKLDPKNAEAHAGVEKAKKAKNLEGYLKSVLPLINEIDALAKQWDDLRQQSAAGRISDLEFGERVISDFMPRTRDLAERAEALSVDVPRELRSAHEELINVLNLNLQAFSEVVAAIDTGDYSRLTSANKLLSDARAAERRYVQKLEDLAAEYGVRFEE